MWHKSSVLPRTDHNAADDVEEPSVRGRPWPSANGSNITGHDQTNHTRRARSSSARGTRTWKRLRHSISAPSTSAASTVITSLRPRYMILAPLAYRWVSTRRWRSAISRVAYLANKREDRQKQLQRGAEHLEARVATRLSPTAVHRSEPKPW